MKFKILSADKQTLPRYNNQTNQDEPTIMVVTQVEFYTDDGQLFHTQEYAHLPEDVSPEYFQAQADAMQADLDHAKANADTQAASDLADKKIQELTTLTNQPNGVSQE
jgi:hypothetical protein